MKLWLNSELVPAERACISPADHGLLVGDGVFETLRCYAGVPFALVEHAERLIAGARTMGIEPPSAGTLEAAVAAVVEANKLSDARIRITLTSGPGPPGLERGAGPATLMVTGGPLRPWPPTATAIVSGFRRDNASPLAGVKTVAAAEKVMALAEARRQGADEALFTNTFGELCEATTANVFLVLDGVVETPPPTSGCLLGITRSRVMALCPQIGIRAAQAGLRPLALKAAEEIFLTSSTREVQPLVQVDGEPVGSGEPGPVTMRLAAAFAAMVAGEVAAR